VIKILLVFSSSQLGGAERSLSRMALAPSGDVDYHLATLEGEGSWSGWIREQGKQPLVLGRSGSGRVLQLLRACWRLVKYARRHSVDVIYVCGSRAAFILRFLRVFIPNIKLVHGVRWNPNSNSRLDRFFRLMERITHPLVDGWITNSKIARETLISQCGIPADKVFTIYNGLEALPEVVPPLYERPMEVLTVANLNPRKGHREYLQVIREVVKAVPEARFVFVGRDDMDGEIQRSIDAAGLAEFVQCEGFQPDVSQWYRRARLFVLPSLWGEGCPTSILEAFSYGIPVVAYGIDGIPELVLNHVDGVLMRCGDKKGFEEAVTGLLLDVEQAGNMGKAGRMKVEQHFILKGCASQHSKVFSHLLVGKT